MAIACSTSIRCGSSLDVALKTIHDLGFKQIDLLTIGAWAHVNPRNLADHYDQTAKPIDSLLEKYGLTMLASNTGTTMQLWDRSPQAVTDRKRELQALCRFLQERKVKVAAIQPLSKDTSRAWEQVITDCVQTLREQKAIGDQHGITFCLELHVHSPFETIEQAKQFMELMPEMPVVYDPTHFVMQGMDIRTTGWIMDRAKHVHIRDAAPGKIQERLGAGKVDFDWVFAALKDRGYTGHFSIEYLEDKQVDFSRDARHLADRVAQSFPA